MTDGKRIYSGIEVASFKEIGIYPKNKDADDKSVHKALVVVDFDNNRYVSRFSDKIVKQFSIELEQEMKLIPVVDERQELKNTDIGKLSEYQYNEIMRHPVVVYGTFVPKSATDSEISESLYHVDEINIERGSEYFIIDFIYTNDTTRKFLFPSTLTPILLECLCDLIKL